MNQLAIQQWCRISCVLGAAVLLLAAVSAGAANLVDVRIGLHEEYTRVVLETDAKASCEVESSGSEELVLRLGASSGVKLVPYPRSTHLVSVAVKPIAAGDSEIRVALRGPVELKKMVLSGPPRIVLDLREGKAADAMAPTAPPPAPPAPLSEAAESAAPPESPAELPSETAPSAPPEPLAEKIEAAEEEEAVAPPSAPEPDPGAVLAAEEEEEQPAALGDSDRPRRVVVPPPPVSQGGLLDRLPAPLNQPLVLAGVALAVILLIAIVLMRRRGAASEQEPITPFAAGEPFSVDEKPELAEEPEAEQAEEGLPAPFEEEGEESSLFDQPVETAEPAAEEPAADDVEVAMAPPVAESPRSPDLGQEMEQRLANLERRLEEFTDERERLGRQVAAQTEELRVQRAAIARTQRVLRDLTRPADEATEPAPKE